MMQIIPDERIIQSITVIILNQNKIEFIGKSKQEIINFYLFVVEPILIKIYGHIDRKKYFPIYYKKMIKLHFVENIFILKNLYFNNYSFTKIKKKLIRI